MTLILQRASRLRWRGVVGRCVYVSDASPRQVFTTFIGQWLPFAKGCKQPFELKDFEEALAGPR